MRRFDVYCYRLLFSQRLTLHYREGLLLRLTGDDGSEGWGESAPLPGFSGESLQEAATRLRELVGMEPQELEEQGYVRAVVLKPTLVGGISRTLRLGQSALRLDMMPGVGTAALVALAAGIGGPPGACRPGHVSSDGRRPPRNDVGLAPSVGVREIVEACRRVDVRKLEALQVLRWLRAGSGALGYTTRHVASFLCNKSFPSSSKGPLRARTTHKRLALVP